MFKRLFIEHPASVDETYGGHFLVASSFAFNLLLAAMASIVHAIIPGLFVKTGSNIITKLHDQIIDSRTPQTPSPAKPVEEVV